MSFEIKPSTLASKFTRKVPHICVALPSHSGTFTEGTMNSLMHEMRIFQESGCRCSIMPITGAADIRDVRAICVAQFLANPDYTHLFFVDSDVVWAAGSMARLVAHNVDFVAGLYPSRSDPLNFPYRSFNEPGEESVCKVADNGLIELLGVPGGFVCLKRTVLEQMVKAYEHTWFDVGMRKIAIKKAWDLFETYRLKDEPHCKLSEDYAFCQRWIDIGGKVLVDPTLEMGHIGPKTFRGSAIKEMFMGPATDDAQRRAKWLETSTTTFEPPADWQAPPLTVALCIPTRGRHESLRQVLDNAKAGVTQQSTRIVVGCDSDDKENWPRDTIGPVYPIFAEREDSVGAKYNRMFRAIAADLYIQGADDLLHAAGWDAAIAKTATKFKDGIGVVYLGKNLPMDGPLPSGGFAVTKRFLDLMGGFPEFSPFWWYDTWVSEIAMMIGRIEWAPVDAELVGGTRGKTRGLRDAAFWQTLFAALRPKRAQIARNMINNMLVSSDQRKALLGNIPELCAIFARDHDNMRDPDIANRMEGLLAYDAPEDERYKRIKLKGEVLLLSLMDDETLGKFRQIAARQAEAAE